MSEEAPKGFHVYPSMGQPGYYFNQCVRLEDGRVVEFRLDKHGYLSVEMVSEDTEAAADEEPVLLFATEL